jgi:hypothetical protein
MRKWLAKGPSLSSDSLATTLGVGIWERDSLVLQIFTWDTLTGTGTCSGWFGSAGGCGMEGYYQYLLRTTSYYPVLLVLLLRPL